MNKNDLTLPTQDENSTRKLGLDVLKIFLFIFVVLLHINNKEMGGAFNYAQGNALYGLKTLESIAVIAVPCFILISGYFLNKKTKFQINKVLFIYILNTSYCLICYVLDVLIFKTQFTAKEFVKEFIPRNYYLNFYSVLIFISPLLNRFFKIKQKYQIVYLSTFLCLFVLFPTAVDLFNSLTDNNVIFPWMSTNGDNAGYTLIYFILMYLIGGFISTNKVRLKKYITLPIYFLLTIVITIISIKTETIWNYNDILVTTSSIMLFMFFESIDSCSNRVVSSISSCSLGVFVLHTTKFVIPDILSCMNMSKYVNDNTFSSMLFVVLSSLIISLTCAIVDYLLRLSVSPLKKKIMNISFIKKSIIDLDDPLN